MGPTWRKTSLMTPSGRWMRERRCFCDLSNPSLGKEPCTNDGNSFGLHSLNVAPLLGRFSLSGLRRCVAGQLPIPHSQSPSAIGEPTRIIEGMYARAGKRAILKPIQEMLKQVV